MLDLVYPIVGTADIFRRDLPNSRHGGVLIVSRKHFQLGNIITNQYPSRVNQSFLDMVSDNSFEEIVNFPTRKQNTLYIILTTHPNFTQRCKPMPILVTATTILSCSILQSLRHGQNHQEERFSYGRKQTSNASGTTYLTYRV